MKISCEIIRDLLPLYHDGVCSNESKGMVDEHLAECEACRAELSSMDKTLIQPDTKQNLEEAEAVVKLSKQWRKGMLKSVLQGALFTLLTVIVILFFMYIFIDINIM